VQIEVTVEMLQPTCCGKVHDKLKMAEVLVDAVTEHDELVQPAALEASASAHTSEVNCESEVPDSIVKVSLTVLEKPGMVEHEPL